MRSAAASLEDPFAESEDASVSKRTVTSRYIKVAEGPDGSKEVRNRGVVNGEFYQNYK